MSEDEATKERRWQEFKNQEDFFDLSGLSNVIISLRKVFESVPVGLTRMLGKACRKWIEHLERWGPFPLVTDNEVHEDTLRIKVTYVDQDGHDVQPGSPEFVRAEKAYEDVDQLRRAHARERFETGLPPVSGTVDLCQ